MAQKKQQEEQAARQKAAAQMVADAKKRQEEQQQQQRKQQAEKQAAVAQLQKKQAQGGSFRVTASGGPTTAVPKKLSKQAPRGVPTIVKWIKRRDGGISGRIYGSPNFNDGERIETSAIIDNGSIENGSVVKTGSGSRYFLSDETPTTKGGDTLIKTLMSALPGATISLTKKAKEQDAKAAVDSMKEAKPRATFSLFGLGASAPPPAAADVATTTTPPSQKPGFKRSPPRGVPTIRRWRKNRDGSISGRIYGSPNFTDGEQVTTSTIAQGTLAAGEIVRTGSGSRYFLE